MFHRAWSNIREMPRCSLRSSIKFQGHMWQKSPIFTQIVHFRTVTPEFTNGYEMLHKAWNSKGQMSYCFPRSSIKFQGHAGQNITDFDPNCAFPDYRPVAAFKSLRFALFVQFWPIVFHIRHTYRSIECNHMYSLFKSPSSSETGRVTCGLLHVVMDKVVDNYFTCINPG